MGRDLSLSELTTSSTPLYATSTLAPWAPHWGYLPVMPHGYVSAPRIPLRPYHPLSCVAPGLAPAPCRPDHVLRQMCMMTQWEPADMQSGAHIDACMEGVDRAMRGMPTTSLSMARGACLVANACHDDTQHVHRQCSTGAVLAADNYIREVYG